MDVKDLSWFDEKHKGKGRLSCRANLSDRMQLLRQVFSLNNIKISDRNKDSIERVISECLFELKRDFKPSLYTLAHQFLFCYGPILNIDKEKNDKYLKDFMEITEKYKDKYILECPFDANAIG